LWILVLGYEDWQERLTDDYEPNAKS